MFISRQDVVLLAGVAAALAVLREHGFLPIVITNQSGIRRGYYNHFDVFAVHRVIQGLLKTVATCNSMPYTTVRICHGMDAVAVNLRLISYKKHNVTMA